MECSVGVDFPSPCFLPNTARLIAGPCCLSGALPTSSGGRWGTFLFSVPLVGAMVRFNHVVS